MLPSPTTYCDDFSPSRMRQLAWWLDPTGQTISHQSCNDSTGCLWGDVSSLSWLCSYTSCWMVQHLATCLMTSSEVLNQLVSDVGRRRLRSSDVSTCVVPRTHTGFGDRAFQVAGPRLWNNLPASLRQSHTTVGQFKKLLKTHLFSWDCGALVTAAFPALCINISTTTIKMFYVPAAKVRSITTFWPVTNDTPWERRH